MSAAPADPTRRRELARIHVHAAQLDMDEETYRAFVERVSGELGRPVRSAGQLDAEGRRAVIRELVRLGARSARQREGHRAHAGRPKGELSPQLRKVEALLADAGRPWAYAHAMARRMCGTTRVEWCRPPELSKLIAALSIDSRRRGSRPDA